MKNTINHIDLVTYRGGRIEKETKSINEISVPDLWHLAQEFRSQGNMPAHDAILNTWHIAHALLDTLLP